MNNTATKTNSKFTIQQIAMIAVMTAVTCVLAPLSIPIGPVPISLTNLVIYFSLFRSIFKNLFFEILSHRCDSIFIISEFHYK